MTARGAPSERHRAPHAALQGMAASEPGLGRTTEQGSLGAGGKSLQSSAERGTELKGRGPALWASRQGFPWWCRSNDPGLD